MEPYKLTVPVEFTITRTLEGVPLGFQVTWVEAKAGDPEVRLDLSCGAGVASSLMQGTARMGTERAYATASIKPAANVLFTELEKVVRGQREECPDRSGMDRSLAFTALHDLKPWFRRLLMNAGSEVITVFLQDYHEAMTSGDDPGTIYDYARRWGA